MHIFKNTCFAVVLYILTSCSTTDVVSVTPIVDTVEVVKIDTVFQRIFDPRDCLVQKSFEYVGIREATGNNDGPEIKRFLAFVGFDEGNAWCAAIMSVMYYECNVTAPRSAWSPDWANAGEIIWQQGDLPSKARMLTRAGDHFTIYYNSKGRVGHVGMIVRASNSLNTFEGNTNDGGSREGDGTYFRVRPYSMIYQINSLINE